MKDYWVQKLVDRFLKYVKFNTQSNENSKTIPSTIGQLEFAKFLADELIEIGMEEVEIDEFGYVTATLPANEERKSVVGFIAHMDTSPDVSGENVNPQIVEYYGKPIVLNKESKIILSSIDFPSLNNYIGQKIIVTDGTTLLGADDKAGIAEIVTAMEYLIKNQDVKHGKVRIAFTPDEEIGRGVDKFDVKKFGADFAFTVDGGALGEIEYENFNAAKAKITINGLNVHPGMAKNKMKNSILIAMELIGMLPPHQTPEHTDNYEGFYHITDIQGNVEKTVLNYLIRDHNKTEFEKKKHLLIKIVDHLNMKYGSRTVQIIMLDQYYNMKEKIEPNYQIIELAIKAMTDLGIKPKIVPIRGGTDGSRLSFMGLLCPNIFTGGHNFHSKYEFIPINSLDKAMQTILKIIQINDIDKKSIKV